MTLPNAALTGSLAAHQSLTIRGANSSARATASFTNVGAITLDGSGVGAGTSPPRLSLANPAVLTNTGTITTQASGSSAAAPQISASVTNTGTIDINTGTSYNLPQATLDNKGVLNLADGATLTSSGSVIDDTRGQIIATGSGQLVMTGGDGVYDQGAGTVIGSTTVLIGDYLNYTGTGTSKLVIPPVRATTITGNIASGQSLTITGPDSSATASTSMTNAGAITIDATGVGVSQTPPTLQLTSGTLTNSGTITTQASGTPANGPQVLASALDNTGTLDIGTSSVDPALPDTLDNKGTISLADGATFTVDGTVINDSGGHINATGSGQVKLASNDGVYDQGDGTTSGMAPVAVLHYLDYTGTGRSSILVPGETTTQLTGNLAPGQSLTVHGPDSVVTASSVWRNAGSVTMLGTSSNLDHHVTLRGGALTNTGTITTEVTGTSPLGPELALPIENSGTINVDGPTFFDPETPPALTNSGTLNVAAGQTASCAFPGAPTCNGFEQTGGSIALGGPGATVLVPTLTIAGGALTGDGAVSGDLVNNSRVAPGAGASPGTIAVSGAYTQGASGALDIGVAQSGADTLTVGEHAALAGTLALSTIGTPPTSGQSFTPLTDGSQSGQFATVTGLDSGPFNLSYDSTDVKLTVLSTTSPVPPTMSVGSVTLRNPGPGDGTASFPVTLSAPATGQVTVDYATADGTALAPGDYAPASGTLTFAPGQTQKTIDVTVHGTTQPGPDRTLYVNLTNPNGVRIAQAQGTATILNDRVALSAVSPGQGGQGGHVTLTLSGAGFTGTPMVKLSRPGHPDIVATGVQTFPSAQAMIATVDLAGAGTGSYGVTVTLPPFSASATLPGAFTVGVPIPANVIATLEGRPDSSTNEPWTGTLTYTNTGTVDAHNSLVEIDGFQSEADVTVTGGDASAIQQDTGASHSVLIWIPVIAAQSSGSVQVTFTPVGHNYTVYTLQPFTLVSSDDSFTPTNPDPTVTVTAGPPTQSGTTSSGVLQVGGASGGGDLSYNLDVRPFAPGRGAIPAPTSTQTTLPDGELQFGLSAVVGPPATNPPTSGGVAAGVAPFINGFGPLGLVQTAGDLGAAPPSARVASAGPFLKKVTIVLKGAKKAWQTVEKLKSSIGKMNAALDDADEEKRITDCLHQLGYVDALDAGTADRLADGSVFLTAFEQLQSKLNLQAGDALALKLLEGIVQTGWGQTLFGGGIGNGGLGTADNGGGALAHVPPFDAETPERRLVEALKKCPHNKARRRIPNRQPRLHAPFHIDIRNSVDPNEIVGPQGFGTQHFIAPRTLLAYGVLFENEAQAAAPAREVRITDQLNPAVVDLSTFSLGTVYFAGVQVAPPPGLKSWQDTVDLRPAEDLLVHITAGLDQASGLVSWDIQAIDPASGQPPPDPLDGFLPPDQSPPEGEGGALFTVEQRAGLASGATIANRASIVFDRNAPIGTPTWINAIDRTPPTSRIRSAKAIKTTFARRIGRRVKKLHRPAILLSWQGQDCAPTHRRHRGRHRRGRPRRHHPRCLTQSGVATFDLYVAVDHSRFKLILDQTPVKRVRFGCTPGRTYRFYTVAYDAVGNVQRGHSPPSKPIRCQ